MELRLSSAPRGPDGSAAFGPRAPVKGENTVLGKNFGDAKFKVYEWILFKFYKMVYQFIVFNSIINFWRKCD